VQHPAGDHQYESRSALRLQTTRKLGCAATGVVKELVFFPAFAVCAVKLLHNPLDITAYISVQYSAVVGHKHHFWCGNCMQCYCSNSNSSSICLAKHTKQPKLPIILTTVHTAYKWWHTVGACCS